MICEKSADKEVLPLPGVMHMLRASHAIVAQRQQFNKEATLAVIHEFIFAEVKIVKLPSCFGAEEKMQKSTFNDSQFCRQCTTVYIYKACDPEGCTLQTCCPVSQLFCSFIGD